MRDLDIWGLFGTPMDPLDVEYDGVALRDLLAEDELQRHDAPPNYRFTAAQRAAISEHWSEQMRKEPSK